jgi:VWFA-related protein
LALVVAVQSSGISAAALAKVRRIGAMIQPLVTGESGCAALVAFAERVDWRQDCTDDNDTLARAFLRLRPEGERRARMLDAVSESIERLRARPNVRRVVLVISESRDHGSQTRLESVVMAAQAAGVTIYAAPFSAFKTALTAKPSDFVPPPLPKGTPPPSHASNPIPPLQDRMDILGGIAELARLGKTNTTHALASATGGAAFPFAGQKGLEDAIQKLGVELHTQYLLSFTPQTPAPGYHRLEVRLRRPGDFRLRARPAYWAAQEPR